MKSTVLFLLCFILCAITQASAQEQTLKLWPDKVPGAISNASYKEETAYDENKKSPRIGKVTDPTITVYLPPKEKANGTAVVICPGGGYGRLAIDHEGYDIGVWLKEQGIAGIVLKYRLPSESIMKDKSVGPLQDAQEAIRMVRRHAKEWNINPNKVGIMGFSAGGHVASTASTHYKDNVYQATDTVSARPSFSILIYPVISMTKEITHGGSQKALLGATPEPKLIERFSNELQVTADTPPAFLVHSTDDGTVPVQNSIDYLLALKRNKVPAELHIYEKGGHGYGMGRSSGTESTWPEACKKWLKARGLL